MAILVAVWGSRQLHHVVSLFLTVLRRSFARYLIHGVAIRRTRYWSGATWLQYCLFLVLLGVNTFCLVFKTNTRTDLIIRSGIIASINMVPMFLGGRSNVLVDLIGIPLHVHHFFHHWIGRLSIFLALLHSGLAISHHMIRHSGWMAAGALLLVLIFSLFFIRRIWYEIFLVVHRVLAFVALAGLVWHLSYNGLNGKKLIIPSTALGLWLIGFINSLWNLRTRSEGIVNLEKFTGASPENNLFRVTMNLKYSMSVRPGQFVYLRWLDHCVSSRFQTHPFMISWWEVDEMGESDEKVTSWWKLLLDDVEPKATSLTFLIRPMNGITRRLANDSRGTSLGPISFTGPFGQTQKLENYDNVYLICQGIGIAGVLSYAKQLVSWMKHPTKRLKVQTRKLDLFWDMDDCNEARWIGSYLSKLQASSEKINFDFLHIWCYLPNPRFADDIGPILESQDQITDDYGTTSLADKENARSYRNIYPSATPNTERIITRVKESGKTGRSIMLCSGNSDFTNDMRDFSLRLIATGTAIKFVETEYRPTNCGKARDILQLTGTSTLQPNITMQNLEQGKPHLDGFRTRRVQGYNPKLNAGIGSPRPITGGF